MKKISIQTNGRTDFVDLTDRVQEALAEAAGGVGAVVAYVPHTTAGITINEHADPDVVADMIGALDRLVPWRAGYQHAEGNAAAHIKASLMGSSVTVPVQQGHLALGTWQGIFFCEFDGPRQRTVHIQFLPAVAEHAAGRPS